VTSGKALAQRVHVAAKGLLPIPTTYGAEQGLIA
jgi:hypothetical protein